MEAAGDQPITWKEEVIGKQLVMIKGELSLYDDFQEKQKLWQEFLDWKAWINSLTERPDGC